MARLPEMAFRQAPHGGIEEVPATDLRIGDIVILRLGVTEHMGAGTFRLIAVVAKQIRNLGSKA